MMTSDSAGCRHCGKPTKNAAHTECNRCAARLLDSAETTADEAVTLSRADVKALLGLLIWVHDSILRQPDNDALLRRVGAAMGRAS